MIQEDKELLLKDLCARLPYGMKFLTKVYFSPTEDFVDRIYTIRSINSDGTCKADEDSGKTDFPVVWSVRPYLFPLSSMTEEQRKEESSFDPFKTDEVKTLGDWAIRLVEFYNKHHFDYHGLIEKGLAIDATGLNVY